MEREEAEHGKRKLEPRVAVMRINKAEKDPPTETNYMNSAYENKETRIRGENVSENILQRMRVHCRKSNDVVISG